MEGTWRNVAGIRGLDISNVRASLGLSPGAIISQVRQYSAPSLIFRIA